MLLAAVGQKSEAKSERILNDLAGAELLNFADGHEDIPKILQRLSIDPGYLKKVGILILAPLFMFTINLLFLSLHHNPWLSKFTWILFLMLLGIAAYLWYLWQRLKKAKWGIGKGLEFHKWIKGILDKNGISSMVELRERCYLTHEELNLRMPNSSHFAGSDLTLITCDITRGLKVQFPKEMPDYNLKMQILII